MKIAEKDEKFKLKLSKALPLLNKPQSRILMVSEARTYGQGRVLTLSRKL